MYIVSPLFWSQHFTQNICFYATISNEKSTSETNADSETKYNVIVPNRIMLINPIAYTIQMY